MTRQKILSSCPHWEILATPLTYCKKKKKQLPIPSVLEYPKINADSRYKENFKCLRSHGPIYYNIEPYEQNMAFDLLEPFRSIKTEKIARHVSRNIINCRLFKKYASQNSPKISSRNSFYAYAALMIVNEFFFFSIFCCTELKIGYHKLRVRYFLHSCDKNFSRTLWLHCGARVWKFVRKKNTNK